jgi:hypothetical protein
MGDAAGGALATMSENGAAGACLLRPACPEHRLSDGLTSPEKESSFAV